MKNNHITTAPTWKVTTAFAMIYLVWGSTFFFIHKALSGFEPFLLGAIRFTTAGGVLLVWGYWKGYRIFDKGTILLAALMGILLLYIDNGIIIWVEQYMPSGLVAIMSASAAIWFIILDKPQWRTNFRNLPVVFGLFMGFFGVILLFGDRLASVLDATQRQTNIIGMIMLLVGTLAWTAGSLYSKYFGTKKHTPGNGLVGTGWQMFLAGLAFWLTAVFRGETARFQITEVPTSSWWAIAYLIFFGSILAYSAYIWLLHIRPATQVSTHTYVNPVVAVLLGSLFAGETVSSSQVVALTVILSSVVLINWDAYGLSRFFHRKRSFTSLRQRVSVRAKIRRAVSADAAEPDKRKLGNQTT